ncbi:Putative uncharacterized protein [Lactococcus lactis subsp. lactis A12]|uniref:Uncharacterized protein n=1 Tax=Lactococcus lactis subsp. lactis A12 TaxID=1137134 RepID=S6FF85_LACLL|nr:Putative uncharacterized protein [Lactococcus lactis subsp. lactis A12]SBW31018.1 Hypothetical protein LLA12_01871 [Lactococcus lactis subsp. lactis]
MGIFGGELATTSEVMQQFIKWTMI